MIIYMKDILKNLLKKIWWIIGLFIVLFVITFLLLKVENGVKERAGGEEELILSEEETQTALLYYQADTLLDSISAYQNNSILMKIDCNNAWYSSLIYSCEGEADWRKGYIMSSACHLELINYIKENIGTDETGYEDIIEFSFTTKNDNSELVCTSVEIYYYEEEGLHELVKLVKEFFDGLGDFELKKEYSAQIRSNKLAQRQSSLFQIGYQMYSNKANIKNRLTLNGERYYNSLNEENFGIMTDTSRGTLSTKKMIAYALIVAIGGILIQSVIYSFFYIRKSIKENDN